MEWSGTGSSFDRGMMQRSPSHCKFPKRKSSYMNDGHQLYFSLFPFVSSCSGCPRVGQIPLYTWVRDVSEVASMSQRLKHKSLLCLQRYSWLQEHGQHWQHGWRVQPSDPEEERHTPVHAHCPVRHTHTSSDSDQRLYCPQKASTIQSHKGKQEALWVSSPRETLTDAQNKLSKQIKYRILNMYWR